MPVKKLKKPEKENKSEVEEEVKPPIDLYDEVSMKIAIEEGFKKWLTEEEGVVESHKWNNIINLIAFFASATAAISQFYPGEFPDDTLNIVIVCVVVYAILTALQQYTWSALIGSTFFTASSVPIHADSALYNPTTVSEEDKKLLDRCASMAKSRSGCTQSNDHQNARNLLVPIWKLEIRSSKDSSLLLEWATYVNNLFYDDGTFAEDKFIKELGPSVQPLLSKKTD